MFRKLLRGVCGGLRQSNKFVQKTSDDSPSAMVEMFRKRLAAEQIGRKLFKNKMFRKLLRGVCGGLRQSNKFVQKTSDDSPSAMVEMFRKRLAAEQIGRKFAVSEDELAEISSRVTTKVAQQVASTERLTCWKTQLAWPPAWREGPNARPPLLRALGGRYGPRLLQALAAHPAASRFPKALAGPAAPRFLQGLACPPRPRQFLGLELTGPRSFRTRLVDLSAAAHYGADHPKVWTKTHELPDHLRTGSGDALFEHMAGCVVRLAEQHGVREDCLPVAFTFGFPVYQASPTSAFLARWTKEFDCDDLRGRDVVHVLRESLHRMGLVAGEVTLLNDATATMLNIVAGAPATRVSLVVADGTNCCYVDGVPAKQPLGWSRLRNEVVKVLGLHESPFHLVNTEWGAFGWDGLPWCTLTECDRRLDARSRHPGQRLFEKMTSGMYMGELVREMVLAMADDRDAAFNGGTVTRAMATEYSLSAVHLCLAESDARGTYAAGREVLRTALDVAEPTDADCELFRYACECVTKRSAHLVAAGLAGVLCRVGDGRGVCGHNDDTRAGGTPIVVAVDGTVFAMHGRYADTVDGMTRRLLRERDRHIEFALRCAAVDRGKVAGGDVRLMADLLQ